MDKGQPESSNPSVVHASGTAPAIVPTTCPGTHSPASSWLSSFPWREVGFWAELAAFNAVLTMPLARMLMSFNYQAS